MVVKCLQCNSHSVFHAWIGVKSRVTAGCRCPNQVWIDNDENIRAEDFDKIEVWSSADKEFISHSRYMKICSTQKAKHSPSTDCTRG